MILNTDDHEILKISQKESTRKSMPRRDSSNRLKIISDMQLRQPEKSRITCSIGIASAGDVRKEEDINELIRSADEILYKVKTGEKGHYAFL